jgi:hypothetical protein
MSLDLKVKITKDDEEDSSEIAPTSTLVTVVPEFVVDSGSVNFGFKLQFEPTIDFVVDGQKKTAPLVLGRAESFLKIHQTTDARYMPKALVSSAVSGYFDIKKVRATLRKDGKVEIDEVY